MEETLRRTRIHSRTTVALTTLPPRVHPEVVLAPDDEDKDPYRYVTTTSGGDKDIDYLLLLSKPAGWLIRIVAVQVELVVTTLLFLSSTFLSLLSDSKHSAKEVAYGGGTLLRKLGFGIIGAVYVCLLLLTVMVVAVLLGVGIVRLWIEDPVSLRQPLHFDYTVPHPSAVVSLAGRGRRSVIPAGHTVCISLVLHMPESDFNRRVGVFQVTAEAVSSAGDVIAKSSQPCILRFKSLPVQLMQTFIMGIPLLTGFSEEIQKITIDILNYKENSNPKTEAIVVRIIPRSGTTDVPQLYTAEIIIKTKLPWRKEVAHNWKWTLCVWISLYVYITLLIVLLCCFKPLVFPRNQSYQTGRSMGYEKDPRCSFGNVRGISSEFSDALKRLRDRSKSKRKVITTRCIHTSSSSTVGGGETSEAIDDSGEVASSESSACTG